MPSDPFLSYVRTGIKPGLRRIRALLALMGHPERSFQSIIVAGSNGKGTTAAFLHSMLGEAGLKSGLFTSPHLVSVRERFRMGPKAVSLKALQEFERQHGAHCRKVGATYFEVTTACAIWLFARTGVDWAVLEIGLGGRWDACNVVQPALSLITSISREHTEYLGSTLAQIAREKSQVARPGRPVVVGTLPYSAERAVRSELRHMGARGFWLGRDFKVEHVRTTPEGTHALWTDNDVRIKITTPLLGRHAASNAALAAKAYRILVECGDIESQCESARVIQNGTRNVYWPARLQVVGQRPLTVVDVAHNEAAIRELALNWQSIWPDQRPWVVMGLLGDKVTVGIGKTLGAFADSVVLTQPTSSRASSPEQLKRIFEPFIRRIEVARSVSSAIKRARAGAGARGAVLVCGSHYVIGPALKSRIKWS